MNAFKLIPGSVYIDTAGDAEELLLCTQPMFASIAKELSLKLEKGYCMVGLYTGCLWDNSVPKDQCRYEIWDNEIAQAITKCVRDGGGDVED